MVGNSITRPKLDTIPRIGIHGRNGVRKGRFISGLVFLKINTDADTIINAARVPILTNSAMSVMGRNADKHAAAIPTTIIPLMGVLNIL